MEGVGGGEEEVDGIDREKDLVAYPLLLFWNGAGGRGGYGGDMVGGYGDMGSKPRRNAL